MTEISIVLDEGGQTGTVVIAGVPVIASAVSPPPPPPPPPPAEVVYTLALSIDKDPATLKVGDTFMLTAVMQGSDGSSKPATAYRIYGFDSSVINKIDPVSDWQRNFTALAPGVTTIKDDYASQTAKLQVTVLPADANTPPVDTTPPIDPTPTSPPPPPPPPSGASTDIPSVDADGLSILYHYPMDVTLAAAVDHIELPGTFGGAPETVAKIAWNFGDGTNGFGADGRHPYDKPGTYTVTGSVNYKDGRIVPFGPLSVTVAA